MEQHKGTVSVYSAGEGHGTTFTVRLPCIVSGEGDEDRNEELFDIEPEPSHRKPPIISSTNTSRAPRPSIHADQSLVTAFQPLPQDISSKAHNPLPNAAADQEEEGEEEAMRRKMQRVLVVDDSDMNRKMVCKVLLGTKEFLCDQAADGSVAVEIMRRQMQIQLSDASFEAQGDTGAAAVPYDIILMDYQMPEMDGTTAIEEIRRLGYRGIILGLTGNALVHDREVMLKSGADGVLVKPLNIQLFRQILKDLSAK